MPRPPNFLPFLCFSVPKTFLSCGFRLRRRPNVQILIKGRSHQQSQKQKNIKREVARKTKKFTSQNLAYQVFLPSLRFLLFCLFASPSFYQEFSTSKTFLSCGFDLPKHSNLKIGFSNFNVSADQIHKRGRFLMSKIIEIHKKGKNSLDDATKNYSLWFLLHRPTRLRFCYTVPASFFDFLFSFFFSWASRRDFMENGVFRPDGYHGDC